jgi:glycosyltransferase involved in cell wall biosynthesis
MKILFLLTGEIIKEQRIGKEIETLNKMGNEIIILTLPSTDQKKNKNSDHFSEISVELVTRRLPRNILFWPIKFIEMTFHFVNKGFRVKPDIIHTVDLLPLFSASVISMILRVPYIYDSQEIHSGINNNANKPKAFWLWLERILSRRAIRVLVTDKYRLYLTKEILKLNESKMFVLMNFPKKTVKRSYSKTIREVCSWKFCNLAIYAGAISPNRHIEDIIKSLQYLNSSFRIVLVGFVEKNYKQSLIHLIKKIKVQDRIKILPPVHWTSLPHYISSADCAFVFYKKNSLNNYYCSPSKLFDALMAGIPVISSNNPLVIDIVKNNGAGVCINNVSPESIADSFKEISLMKDDEINKNRLSKIAHRKYSWESQETKFMKFYQEVEEEMKQFKLSK